MAIRREHTLELVPRPLQSCQGSPRTHHQDKGQCPSRQIRDCTAPHPSTPPEHKWKKHSSGGRAAWQEPQHHSAAFKKAANLFSLITSAEQHRGASLKLIRLPWKFHLIPFAGAGSNTKAVGMGSPIVLAQHSGSESIIGGLLLICTQANLREQMI